MKKIIFLIICFLFCSSIFKAQILEDEYKILRDLVIVNNANDFFDFYNKELSKDIQTENWKTYSKQLSNKINNLYLLDENNKNLRVNNTSKITFKEIDIYNKKNINLLKKGINAWKVIQILEGNRIIIKIIDFIINYENKNYQFTNVGGSTTIYEYSCEEKKWKMKGK
ncbi:hypothetical protein ACFOWU_09575 [Epilithonimonas zeae]|uniref:Nuclear transport factor 2 family protein n=1 Tax=Epilithonimonas zeae TaxID=1416779 RepID=A0A1N6GR14_9FLAO|nr:hypothetical protein [Epilithonimonas zeae]SIO09980.1 hypothetical protein SAMN05444409_1998 [Epilithonimonas zeae]